MRASERTWTGVSAIAAGLVAMAVATRFGGAAEPEIAGLPTAGPLTAWGLPLVRFCSHLCAVATVGTLLAATVLAPPAAPEKAACLRAAGRWAAGWAATGLLSYLLTVSDIAARPVTDLLAAPGDLAVGLSVPQARASLLVGAVAAAVGLAARLPRRPPAWIPLLVATSGLLPPAFVGHASSAADHDIALSALIAHLVAVSWWVGGLGALLVHFRRSDRLSLVLPRFSGIALCCFLAVALSGVAAAWTRLETVAELWRSEYGRLLLAKVAVLGVLALFGRAHRRRTVAHVADRSVRRLFVRLALGEVIVMAVAMGLAVALSRTPPPVPGGGGAGHDFRVLEYDLAPFTPGALLGEVRLDPLVLLLLALPAAGYLIGVRRAGPWPLGRTLAWCAGLALMAFVLLGGVGGYARAMFPVHAAQHVALAVVAPLLLCLGAPLTLAARAAPRHVDLAARLMGAPTALVVLPVAYLVAFPLLYRTGWLSWSLSAHVPHLVTELLFVSGALLVFWMLAGVDPLPSRITPAVRAGLLGAVAVVHLAVGLFLLLGPPVAAEWFVVAAPQGAPDLYGGQRLAGAVYVLVPPVPLLLLGVRLARSRRPPAADSVRSRWRPVRAREGVGGGPPA
ncbi:MAG TPA: cytochrome c oxidase assembly protein [Nonomuraea sp.]|nr:cytochrome c oxidase assembly protein [Nonomuraea sp.]